MADPRFYDNRGPIALGELADAIGARLAGNVDRSLAVSDVADVGAASAGELCFSINSRFLEFTAPGQVFVLAPPSLLNEASARGAIALMHEQPSAAFARAAQIFYSAAGRTVGSPSGQAIDPSARIGAGVVVEAGVVIGSGAEIGGGTHIAANAVIGRGVCIGRECYIGPNTSVVCALIGDRVTLHGGVRIGTDGFGFIPGRSGLHKVPQLGRVIIQDDVEVGANACIDRGALGDTVIGEGAKLDNMVHVAHNCRIGRYVMLAAQVGMAGSVTIGDGAAFGGQVGIADHRTIGPGARVAATSGVTKDLPGGEEYGGRPARPIAVWRREVAAVRRLAKGKLQRDD